MTTQLALPTGAHQPRASPFATRDRINIVNSSYNHYGQSVLRPYSRSALSPSRSSLSRSGSAHSSYSYTNSHSHKKPRLEAQPSTLTVRKRPLAFGYDDEGIDDFEAGEVEDEIVELNAESPINSAKLSRPKCFNYKSLINPDSKVKRFLTKLDSDAFSLFSSSSRAQLQLTTVNSLPMEVLKLIVAYVGDYRTQVSCLYVNQNFYQASKSVVYEAPLLTSSYRVAQLISSLKEFPNGELIKRLDLSSLSPGVITRDPNNDDSDYVDGDEHLGPEVLEYAMASWRDWKFRDDPLYGSSMLNSYTLSKTKSNMSCDSTMSVGSSLQRILIKCKVLQSDALELTNMKESVKKRIFKWRKKLVKRKATIKVLTKKPSLRQSAPLPIKRGSKSVNFSVLRDPKDQPFATAHPYTNKFLLKYAGLKDLPIGYILYFIDLCPNLSYLNLSQLTLSSDFKVVNHEGQSKMPSLIESVLGKESESQLARYFSDANVYFKMKSYHEAEFVKLYELDVLKHMIKLEKLETILMSSVTWLNYRNIRALVQGSRSVMNGSLKYVDFTNSGMVRGLRWAKEFEVEELKQYFEEEVEKPASVPENESDVLARTVGMDY